MRNIDMVFFDMDGLMFDTERLRIEACKKVMIDMGLTISEEVLMSTVGLTMEDSKKVFIENMEGDFNYEEYLSTRRKWINDYIDKNGIPIKKGLRELLAFLDDIELKKVVVTGNEANRVEKYLLKSNLMNSFDTIITGEAVERRKPYPDIYLYASQQLGVVPSRCIVLEDSIKGVQAGCAARMKTIMIPDIIQPNSELDGLVFKECGSLLDVIDVIEKLNKENSDTF